MFPLLSRALGSAPNRRTSARTVSARPFAAASCSGVAPLLLRTPMSAPHSLTIASATSWLPLPAAAWSAVVPSGLLVLSLAAVPMSLRMRARAAIVSEK